MDHQQTKILTCCFCQYRANIFGMRLHMVKHRAVEPYDCSLCEYSSNYARSLKSHVDLFHTKKFSCNFCKKIMTKFSLLRHTKKVHGVKVARSRGEPFVAVRVTREKDTNIVDLESESDTENVEISNSDLLLVKLPVAKVVLKRLEVDRAIDDAAEGALPDPPVSKMTEVVPHKIKESLPQPKVPKLTINIPRASTTDVLDVDTIQSPSDCVDLSRTLKEEPLSQSEDAVDVKPDINMLVTLMKPQPPKTMFYCKDCKFATAKKPLLRQHAPKHLLDKNYVCNDCDFKEPNAYIFAKHLASRRTPQGKLIYCCFCEYRTKHIPNLAGHLDKHKPVRLDDCPKCGQTVQTKTALGEHIRKMHLNKTECPDCGKRMTKYSLKKHRMRHTVEKVKKPVENWAASENPQTVACSVPSKPIFRCSNCSYRTRLKSLLRLHVAKHLMPESEWVCSLCSFTDSSGYRFACHLKYHSEEDSYDCCFCDYSTIAVHNLARHLEVHRSIHFFDCSKCDRSFAQRPSIRKHYITHHVEKHECADCGEIMTLSKLQQHRKIHGTNDPVIEEVTDFCPNVYSNSIMVDVNHVYKCDFCNFGTDIEALAAKHFAKHSMDEAFFVCPACQFRDSSTWAFARHLNSRCYGSSGCCFCDYSSSTADTHLARHLEIHRSVHFHDCSKCDKTYTSAGSLLKHFKAYHSDTHTCLDCGEVVTYHELLEHKKLHGTYLNNIVTLTDSNATVQEPYDPSMLHCYHCLYSTKKKSLLRRHAVKHLLDARLKCPDCDLKENNAREFAKHCISCQGGLKCTFCPFTSSRVSSLASHLEIHRPVMLYDCPECKHSSNGRYNIQDHFKKIHVLEYKCPYCDEVMSRFKLKQHRLKHTMAIQSVNTDPDGSGVVSVSVCEPGSLHCSYCDFSTDIQSLHDRHVEKHQVDQDLTCPQCGFAESNPAEFAKHLRTHGQSKTFDCCFCNFSTFYFSKLPYHLEIHKSVHFFDCPKCDKNYTCKSNLKSHYQKFHVAQHECPSCSEVVTYDKLLMHREMHAEQENPYYCCDDCSYETRKKSLIRKHVGKHLDCHFVCPNCQHRETSADKFVAHLMTHSASGILACCFCKYSTTESSSLSEHLEVHRYRSVGFYDCAKCEKSFKKRSKLTEHNRQHHKEKHRCSICGSVMTYSRLIRHMKLHNESGLSVVGSPLSKRFRCNHCIYTTKRKSLLRRHAPKHLVDNRLSCTICKYKTSLSWSFVTHLISHSSDDVIQCCHCDYSTTSKHNLAGHVDQHRPVHLHDCPKCDKSFLGSSGGYTLQTHFNKWHAQKHVCQKNIRKNVKCNQKMSLYRLQKHNLLMHKAAVKDVPYYVCRGPKSKEVTDTGVTVPVANSESVKIEVVPDMNVDWADN